jgi:hypothetical protein
VADAGAAAVVSSRADSSARSCDEHVFECSWLSPELGSARPDAWFAVRSACAMCTGVGQQTDAAECSAKRANYAVDSKDS